MSWSANFSLALEINKPIINIVLDKYLKSLADVLKFNLKIGKKGSLQAELIKIEVLDLTDIPPLGGVVTDLQAEASLKLVLFGIRFINTNVVLMIKGVEIDLSKTEAGLPKGLVARITPKLAVKLTFPRSKFIMGWILNNLVGPLISLGIWLGFRILRKVEIPVWDLVDIFGALGLRFTPNSPLLTAQSAVPPTSLLLASDFNMTTPVQGIGRDLAHFIPDNTNLGAVVHEKVVRAAVEIAFTRGWVPSRFKVGKWKIYLNSISVAFKKDELIVSGSLKAKRGKCWCRVKARITFKASVYPRVVDVTTIPRIYFTYNADVKTEISTSGMLVVLGVLMFAPVFMSLTLSMSFLINIILNKFLPFKTSWDKSGLQLVVSASSVNFSGFVPLSMKFPLTLSGEGSYDLSNFRTFSLPSNGPEVDVDYSLDSLSLQEDELRLAIDLK
jgi:hypothetical protein